MTIIQHQSHQDQHTQDEELLKMSPYKTTTSSLSEIHIKWVLISPPHPPKLSCLKSVLSRPPHSPKLSPLRPTTPLQGWNFKNPILTTPAQPWGQGDLNKWTWGFPNVTDEMPFQDHPATQTIIWAKLLVSQMNSCKQCLPEDLSNGCAEPKIPLGPWQMPFSRPSCHSNYHID